MTLSKLFLVLLIIFPAFNVTAGTTTQEEPTFWEKIFDFGRSERDARSDEEQELDELRDEAERIAPGAGQAIDSDPEAQALRATAISAAGAIAAEKMKLNPSQDELDRLADWLEDLNHDYRSITSSIAADVFISEFRGSLISTNDLKSATAHSNSKNIVKNLKNALKASPLYDPMAKVGLKHVTIVVMNNLAGSLYIPDYDLIYLSKADIDQFGIGVLYHELLHAALVKGYKAGLISLSHFNYLSGLNTSTFSHLNGYVGTAKGHFTVNGYGYQEAFVVGWSYMKINSHSNTIKNSPTNYIKKAWNYRNFINTNPVLTTLTNGKKVRMIHSGSMTSQNIYDQFLNRFFESNRQVRKVGLFVEANLKKYYGHLCSPEEVKVLDSQQCIDTGSIIYPNDHEILAQHCGDNFRWQPAFWSGCGNPYYRTGDDR